MSYPDSLSPGSLGGACGQQAFEPTAACSTSPGGPRPDDHYAQQKQDYYSSPLTNELKRRQRDLMSKAQQLQNQLNVISELINVLVD